MHIAVRSTRRRCLQSTQACQLGNLGYWLRRPLKWNLAKEEFIGDAEVNKLRSRENREPWNKV